MVFDGAAYYGLPTASQASSSGTFNAMATANAGSSAGSLKEHGNPHRSMNVVANDRTRSRGIIQRPYSHEPHRNAHYGGLQSLQAHQQPWHGQAPVHGQMWQHHPTQPFNLYKHSQRVQPAQYNAAPPLPFGPPPPAPPPLLRHALPQKPQIQMEAVSSQNVQAQKLPAAIKPMRQAPEQQPQDYRAARIAQSDSRPETDHARSGVPVRLFCDICKLRFQSPIHLIAHERNEHVKCCKRDDGCLFEGLPNIVELHEQDRHLVFRPGARREKTRPDGPPGAKIQGTNISLETEEDIAKWVEERKRKWPGSRNQELRLQRELKRKAYEAASPAVVTNLSKAGKKPKYGKAEGPARHPEGYQRAPRIWGQSGSESRAASDANIKAASDNSDEEGAAEDVFALLTQSNGQAQAGGVTESSGPSQFDLNVETPSLRQSDAWPVQEGQAPANLAHIAEMEEESDHESAPEEVEYDHKRAAEDSQCEDTTDQLREPSNTSKPLARYDHVRPPCNAWTALGTCKFGKQCRYEHDPTKRGKPKHEPPQGPKNPFERGDLIGKLVHHEVRHEISDLTQVIDFLARNNWLRQVELYPGHKAELDGRINEVGS